MSIEIRILTGQNAAAYKQLRLRSFTDAPFAFSESYEDEKDKTDSEYAGELMPSGNPYEKFTLGAFSHTNELVGFISFKRDHRTKARHKSMIHAMFVQPHYRNQGIGSLLLRKTIILAQQIAGLEQIHLWVLHALSSAAAFYLKAGFESQGTIVKNDLKIGDIYIDAEYMVLYLNKIS